MTKPTQKASRAAGHRSVHLNRRGRAYYEEVRRILLDIRDITERHGDRRRLRGR